MQEQDDETGSGPRPGPSSELRVPEPFDSAGDARAVLSSERRRAALDILVRAGDPLSIGQLADSLARSQSGEPSTASRQRIYLRLSQTHVPVLERNGLVTYSDAMGVVSLTVDESTVRDLLSLHQGGTTADTGPRIND